MQQLASLAAARSASFQCLFSNPAATLLNLNSLSHFVRGLGYEDLMHKTWLAPLPIEGKWDMATWPHGHMLNSTASFKRKRHRALLFKKILDLLKAHCIIINYCIETHVWYKQLYSHNYYDYNVLQLSWYIYNITNSLHILLFTLALPSCHQLRATRVPFYSEFQRRPTWRASKMFKPSSNDCQSISNGRKHLKRHSNFWSIETTFNQIQCKVNSYHSKSILYLYALFNIMFPQLSSTVGKIYHGMGSSRLGDPNGFVALQLTFDVRPANRHVRSADIYLNHKFDNIYIYILIHSKYKYIVWCSLLLFDGYVFLGYYCYCMWDAFFDA